MEYTTIKGIVLTGRGSAKNTVRKSSHDLEQIIGEKPFPGTLNVVFDKPVEFKTELAHTYNNKKRFLWPVRIVGFKRTVFLSRWSGCPLHAIEIVSPVKLRDKLDIEDEDELRIQIKSDVIKGINILRYLSWIMLWYKRENLYYSSQLYLKVIYNKLMMPVKMLASQSMHFKSKFLRFIFYT